MSSAADRKNKQIWEALDCESPKQALQLCMKRIKKGEKSDYLLARRSPKRTAVQLLD